MVLPRHWRGRAGCRALAAALALLAIGAVRVPLRTELTGAPQRVPPHALAAHLADFNNLRALYPHIESWAVDEQWNNYTSWRYVVRFACGARCAGHGTVAAHDDYAPPGARAMPRHGAAHTHRVLIKLSSCWTLPLLPWPSFCDDTSVESVVNGDGAGGARYAEVAVARAGLAAWLGGRGAALAAERRLYLQNLQAALS